MNTALFSVCMLVWSSSSLGRGLRRLLRLPLRCLSLRRRDHFGTCARRSASRCGWRSVRTHVVGQGCQAAEAPQGQGGCSRRRPCGAHPCGFLPDLPMPCPSPLSGQVSLEEVPMISTQLARHCPQTRNRTIQVHPKDLRVLPGHPEPAVSWHSGFREGSPCLT